MSNEELLEHYKKLYANVKKRKDKLYTNENLLAIRKAIKYLNKYKENATRRVEILDIKEITEMLDSMYYIIKGD